MGFKNLVEYPPVTGSPYSFEEWAALPDGVKKYRWAKTVQVQRAGEWRRKYKPGDKTQNPMNYKTWTGTPYWVSYVTDSEYEAAGVTQYERSVMKAAHEYNLKIITALWRLLAMNTPETNALIAAYNAGDPLNEPLLDAFARYGIPRGQFTLAKAKAKMREWDKRTWWDVADDVVGFVVPVFIGTVAAIATVGLISPATAGAGSATAGTTAGTAAGAGTTTTAVVPATSTITVGGVSTGISSGIAAVDTVIGSTLTGSVVGAAQQVVVGGDVGLGAQAGARSGLTSGVSTAGKDALPVFEKIPVEGYDLPPFLNIPKLDLSVPALGIKPVLKSDSGMVIPAPPGTEMVDQSNAVDWAKVAKVALPAISIVLLLIGRS